MATVHYRRPASARLNPAWFLPLIPFIPFLLVQFWAAMKGVLS